MSCATRAIAVTTSGWAGSTAHLLALAGRRRTGAHVLRRYRSTNSDGSDGCPTRLRPSSAQPFRWPFPSSAKRAGSGFATLRRTGHPHHLTEGAACYLGEPVFTTSPSARREWHTGNDTQEMARIDGKGRTSAAWKPECSSAMPWVIAAGSAAAGSVAMRPLVPRLARRAHGKIARARLTGSAVRRRRLPARSFLPVDRVCRSARPRRMMANVESRRQRAVAACVALHLTGNVLTAAYGLLPLLLAQGKTGDLSCGGLRQGLPHLEELRHFHRRQAAGQEDT